MELIPSEEAEQVALVSYLWKQKGFYYIHSIENSFHFPVAELSKITQNQVIGILSRLKNKRISMGQINGMPDLFIPSLRLYIEMKKIKGGFVSDDQKKCHSGLRSQGANIEVAYGFRHALEIIRKYENEKMY